MTAPQTLAERTIAAFQADDRLRPDDNGATYTIGRDLLEEMLVSAAQAGSIGLDEERRSIVLSALYDKLTESERYLSGSKPSREPRPEDSCCAFHLARYERDVELHRSLKARKKLVRQTIAMFEDLVLG